MRGWKIIMGTLCAAVAVTPGPSSPAPTQEPLIVGNRRQLLFDDRFVQQAKGVEFRVHRPQGGEFTTPRLRFEGEHLLLNVDTSACGELRVEIVGEQGQPVPGRALDDCDIIHTANEINRVVRWKGESAVEHLAGKIVRLRFVLRDADIYAFQFAPRGGI